MNYIKSSLPLLLGVIIIAGCAQSKQSKDVKISGFLGDYTMLKKGGENQALFRFYNPQARSLKNYNKILLDPVVIYSKPGSTLNKLSAESKKSLVSNFRHYLYKEMSSQYIVVSAPRKDAIRVQVALTEAEPSNAFLDTISTVLPIGWVAGAFTDEPIKTGAATVEIRVTDSITGELIAAAVDRRLGDKSLSGSTDKWSDVDAIMQYWAKFFVYKLCIIQERRGCEKPEG